MDSFQVKFEIWSKHGPDMAEKNLTWSQQLDTLYSYTLNQNESALKVLEL